LDNVFAHYVNVTNIYDIYTVTVVTTTVYSCLNETITPEYYLPDELDAYGDPINEGY